MNIFKKLSLINKTCKAIGELKKLKEGNNAIAEEIVAIINDIISILDRIKAVVPTIGDLVDEIIAIIKKWFKK